MYDAIVVGARVAGSPTAMLLARAGHRVLVVDKAAFPSDTLSSHYIHQPGVAALDRWGVLPAVLATGSPPIRDYSLDVGPMALHGTPPPIDGIDFALSAKRTVLDEVLVDAARDAGAEVRTQTAVQRLLTGAGGRVTGVELRGPGGATTVEHARIVIGADGLHSVVAREAGAETYDDHGTLTCAYYAYWRGVAIDHAELYLRPGLAVIAAPTNDDETLAIVIWPHDRFDEVRKDVEGHMAQALRAVPALGDRLEAGVRTARIRGTGVLPNHFRRAHGPGWALVGDAGYHKDPVLALGISDAFRDAELLAGAVDAGLSGHRPLDAALAGYERRRDELSAGGFQSTIEFAQLQAPPPERQALFAALAGDQEQADRFFGTVAGTVPPAEFFAPENLERIMSARGPVPIV
jgi:2-polyprenyl-6-methoxyphenol hydroxylase-like FAD-dependent oxidoreductase